MRDEQMDVLKPEALGLTETLGMLLPGQEASLTAERLFDVLTSADAQQARSLLVASYLRGASLSTLCDESVRGALHHIGTLWSEHATEGTGRDEARGIFIEHQATDLVAQAFGQIRSLMPDAPEDAPVALGGAPAGDPYLLPSQMAAAVLADVGYRVVNLGADTPARSLVEAARAHAPALVWLSISSPVPSDELVAQIRELAAMLPTGTHIVAGGRSQEGVHELEDELPHFHVGNTMAELADLARVVMAQVAADA
ncbi:MAG: cobalamin-dependent protein [Bacteroidota bacterium]